MDQSHVLVHAVFSLMSCITRGRLFVCLWPPSPFLTSPLPAIAHQTLPYHVCSSAYRAEAAPAEYGPTDTEYLKDATAEVASLMVRMPEV